jgi:2-keto-4-pentenoate hydratase/2-oxohepta-3-ene-1,7-dioic acid hydratase in catechol pathway
MRVNRVHDLRHSYATIQLYEHHAPIQYVSEQLGHASMKIPVDTYGHPRQGTSIALADRLDFADTHALRCATAAQLDPSKIEEYSQYQQHEGDVMRWCRFQVGDKVSYGIVEDEARVTAVSGTPFETYTVTATTYPLSAVKLLVPVIPPTFYAGGLNYPEHVQWWAQYSGTPPRVATEPGIGYRTNNALIAHEEHIVKPKDASDEFQVEGELVAVIGKKARHLSPENALSCVLGYTIGNDVSQRTWQLQDGSLWRAKNSDTFKPMGPWIATDLDPNNLETTIRINGQVHMQFNTRHMLFDAASHIAKISRYSTLYPGDVVWLGAEGATPNMRPGDVVEIEISGIGTLRNYVVAEE